MKRSLRYSLFILVAAAAALLFSLTALAVPAAPGTHPDGGACKSHPGTLVTLSDVAAAAAQRNAGPMRAPASDPSASDLPLVVIVIGLDNMPYRDDLDWAQWLFRGERSLAAYYTDMSFGRFTFTPAQESSAYGAGGNTNTNDAANDGVIHVSLPVPHEDWRFEFAYMSQKDKAANLSFSQALIAALEAADAYIDFSAYDTNGDGEITTDELAVAFVVAGYEASTSFSYQHGMANYLWSNAYSLLETKTDYGFSYDLPAPDGVTVNSYIAIAEQEDDGSQEPIGTLAHEMGHYLGLPDLYDTMYMSNQEWSDYSVSVLSLMDYGCYGQDPATGDEIPYSLDVWSRTVLGWVTPETAAADDEGIFTLVSQNYENDAAYSALRVATPNANEYYLLENRSFLKWDAGLAEEFGRADGGVILWHIDNAVYENYSDANEVNNPNHRPAVMPLYAETANGAYSFIGANTEVDLTQAIFDRTVWNGQFSSLGDTLDLPVYGTGSSANRRSGRTLSGVKMGFLSDSAAQMQVWLNPQLHVHAPVYTVATAPTCTGAGAAYYLCGCGKRFADADGAQEITGTFTVEPLGHTEPNADGKCGRCGIQLTAPEPEPEEQEICPYCHGTHSGGLGSLIAFFHRILYFFAHLFGRM